MPKEKKLDNLSVPLYSTASEPGLIPLYEVVENLTGQQQNKKNNKEPSIYQG